MKPNALSRRTQTAVRAVACLSLSLATLLGGCASNTKRADQPKPPTLREWDEFKQAPGAGSGVWIGGQPSDAAIDRFLIDEAGQGGVVVNLRTDEEMAFLPYYDRAVAARGVRYIHIPTTGSSLNMEKVRELQTALGERPGPVMLHCASGGRATYLWAMKRMDEEGLSADEAAAWIEGFSGPPSETSMERLRAFQSERDAEKKNPD